MEQNKPELKSPILLKAVKDHKRQTLWQIWFPLALTITAFIFISVSAVVSSASQNQPGLHWANVSTIFLILPVLLIGMIFLIILAGLVYGVGKLLSITPYYFGRVIEFFQRTAGLVLDGTNKLVAPVMSVRINSSKIKTAKSCLTQFTKNQPVK